MNLAFIAGLLITIGSIYMCRNAYRHFHKAKESTLWPTTEAKIVEARLWGKRLIDGIQQDAEKLSLSYEYTVEDRSYRSSRLAYFTLIYPQTLEVGQKNPVNSHAKVHYNPHNPSEAVLIPGLRPDKPYSDLILAGIGILVGVSLSLAAHSDLIG